MGFSETEIKDITQKFNEIGFLCKSESFNVVKVDPQYADYYLTIHKSKDAYVFCVYRPSHALFFGVYTNSDHCQKIVCKETSYSTIEELIHQVKDIKNIIIDNSVVCKDIFMDITGSIISQIGGGLYDRDSKTVNKFSENLYNIFVEIGELFNKIIMKATNNQGEKLVILNHSDLKELCRIAKEPFQIGYGYLNQTSTEEYIEDFKTVASKLRTLNDDIIMEVKRVMGLKNNKFDK